MLLKEKSGVSSMFEKIITTIITFLISSALGYCVKAIKEYKEKAKKEKENEKVQNQALGTMLQNSLTNTYFVYEKLGEIPDYVYKNWLNLLKAYEDLGLDDYVHILAKKMESWRIVKTDILKKV